MQSTATAPSPAARMFALSTAHWRSCCIYVAAKLNIADLLIEAPGTAAHIANVTNCDAGAIYRLMRALTSIGVFRENESHEFEPTPLGETLASHNSNSMKAWVLTMLGERFEVWEQLLYSIKTGKPGFARVHGMPVWEYYNKFPEQGSNFVQAMEQHTRPVTENVLLAYDFAHFPVIADIGGGNGTLLFSILDSAPGSSGILFDQETVTGKVQSKLDRSHLAARCTIINGDFFKDIPGGADAYIMKNILHDWDDENALNILRTCRKTMKKGSTLLLLEAVIPESDEEHPGKFMDINMLLNQGGRERTQKEFVQLASAAGLQYSKTIHTASPECSIIETINPG